MIERSFWWVAAAQLLVAALLLIGIWLALPVRYAWIDAAGSGLAVLYLASALGLIAKQPWAPRLASLVSWLALVAGLCVVTALAFSVAHLAGQYGPIGRGGALLMGTMAALVLPYLVALPLLQLGWLRQGG